jgi:hypothetical protein
MTLISASAVYPQDITCRQSWMPKDAPAFCSWRTDTQLPEGRTYHSVVSSGKTVYVLGGYRYDAKSNQVVYYDTVVRSVAGADGKLGPWIADQPFKLSLWGSGSYCRDSVSCWPGAGPLLQIRSCITTISNQPELKKTASSLHSPSAPIIFERHARTSPWSP